jgi:transcription elongation factor GreA
MNTMNSRVSVPMTQQGAEQLRNELHNLKINERPRIIKAISEARAHGDLKENAEYHAAKEEQGFIEARIRDIEAKLTSPQIIDIKKMKNDGKVIFGTTIKLLNTKNNEFVTYQIVGEDEADLKQGKISFSSPIARALIGKFAGDIVDVMAPGGIISYEIDNVEYI